MRGGGISKIARTLSGSTLIPLWLTMKPNNLTDLTQKVHLAGFNVSLNFFVVIQTESHHGPRGQPQLYECVKKHMMHGPRGYANRKSPCMKNGKCSRFS